MAKIEIGPHLERHHVWWERRDYTSRVEKALRGHYGFIIPTASANHRLLHAKMAPPIMPTREQMVDCMDYVENAPPALQQDRLFAVRAAAEFFHAIGAENDTETAFNARSTEHHLIQQAGYLSLKMPTLMTMQAGIAKVA